MASASASGEGTDVVAALHAHLVCMGERVASHRGEAMSLLATAEDLKRRFV